MILTTRIYTILPIGLHIHFRNRERQKNGQHVSIFQCQSRNKHLFSFKRQFFSKKMTHNPFSCLWNRFFMPFIISGDYSQGDIPDFEKLSKDQKQVLLTYIYEPHNLDDFREWCKQNRMSKHCNGAQQWLLDFSKNLICSPSCGPIFYVVFFLFYLGAALFISLLLYAALLGLKQIFLS